jgi:hypothetical protein
MIDIFVNLIIPSIYNTMITIFKTSYPTALSIAQTWRSGCVQLINDGRRES